MAEKYIVKINGEVSMETESYKKAKKFYDSHFKDGRIVSAEVDSVEMLYPPLHWQKDHSAE